MNFRPLLTVLSFGINQSQPEINVSNKGRVLKSGKVVSTVNVLETHNKNPFSPRCSQQGTSP
jgi:hypothetical protein